MSMSNDAGDGMVAEINVTPMVDVLLSLLIIFMVATPEPPNEKLPLKIPQEVVVQTPNDPNAALLITIEKDGNARLGKADLAKTYGEMVKQIGANEKAQADSRVVIQADGGVPYGKVIEVMAAAHDAGISEVGVASERL